MASVDWNSIGIGFFLGVIATLAAAALYVFTAEMMGRDQ